MYSRKTAPKVKDGKVQKKNNHSFTALQGYIVDRVRPYKGFKHVIKKKEVHDFISLIDDWTEIGQGISKIILDEGGDGFDGLYTHYFHEKTGIIWLSAWPEEMWVDFKEAYFSEHKWLFELFGVVYQKKNDEWHCYFTESQAKAFMLLHIFLHELGQIGCKAKIKM